MADPIQHVVVLMLENNSFDRMLGCMKAVHPDMEGPNPPESNPFTNPDYPDASRLFAQLPDAQRTVAVDPGHDLDDVLRQIHQGDCKGFVSDFVQHCPQAPQAERYQIMDYFKLGDLPALHALAQNYLICDHWFSSVPGPTWPNRSFIHSGTSLGHIDMPGGIFHPALHLYNQPTVYRRLHEKNISWRIYYGDVPQSLLMSTQLEFPLNYRRMDRFAADVAGSANDFPAYVFIEPSYFGSEQNDQHPPTDVMHGEALIADVYNALRTNEELWASTLFVLIYDEHGGFFDHVAPPATIAPDTNTARFAFNQLGIRVPALLISPWVDPGVFSPVLDHTSLLKYATDKWDLGPLGARVPYAASIASAPVRSTARSDCPKSIPRPDAQPNDLTVPFNSHQVALAGLTQHVEANLTQPGDHTIAEHSRAIAATPEALSRAVAERVQQFFASRAKGSAAGSI
ncbi:MAG TPA: alkaline phosphatase family protein [Bryobacteraceae bacterium]|jgi:phospholipase C|nr:alkaline phosphatase family protein [Bryobacteraceae bacterium]